LLATSAVARLPVAMTGLAIVLRVTRQMGSYSDAGAITAVYVMSGAVLGPRLGRLADRLGRSVVLVTTAAVNGVGVLVLSQIHPRDTPVMLAVSLVAGLSAPPVSACVRSLLPRLGVGGDHDHLYALDSTLQELTFVAGPALVALFGTLAGTAAPLVASAVLGLSGTVMLAAHPALRSESKSGHRPRSRVMTPALLVLVLTGLLLVLGCSILQLGVVGYCIEHHASGESGLLLATWSVGSIVGGFSLGARVNAAGHAGYVVALVATGASFLLLLASPGVPALYPLIVVSGLALVPALGCLYSLAGKIAPIHHATEAFGWIASATQTGLAGGAALGGYLVQRFGTSVTFVVAAGAVFLAAASALTWMGQLTAPPLESTP
jgi:predicted MFS family arabinose efflux permease